MRLLTLEGKYDPAMRQLAVSIIKNCPGKDWDCEIDTIFDFVRTNIRYTLDINEIELIRPPQFILQDGVGDCDDMCVLLATLLECVGHSCTFMAVGFGPTDDFTHVVVLVSPAAEEEAYSLDATEPNPPGWFPPGVTCSMSIRI